MTKDGLRRNNFRVKDLDVSGVATGNIANTIMTCGKTWYVDGDVTASGDGTTWSEAFKTIQEGIDATSADDVVYVASKKITDYTSDPTSYAETLIIPFASAGMALVGVSRGRTQGGLPQVKKGSGSTALLTIRAPGCLIANMGFNGSSSTGGGILLDDDYAAKAAFGTTIANCHFKNCVVTTAHLETGGAIYTTSAGNAWQLLVTGCRFYKNECDICLVGTGTTVPQDWVIEDCIFSGPAANTDCNLFLKGGGSGINGLYINRCIFPALPALSAGTVKRFGDLTGCIGIMSDCRFGAQSAATSGTRLTWIAAGTAMLIPATVFMSNNYGISITASENSIITSSA